MEPMNKQPSTTQSTGTDPAGPGLQRILGVPDAAAIMISNMIGVGILTLPGLVAGSLGDLRWAFAAWALGGLISLAGALIHAELGSRFPQAGGDYVYLREAFGGLAAFLSGWVSFIIGFPGAIALSSVAAANSLLDAAGPGMPKTPILLIGLSLAILGGITLVHSRGIQWGKRFQNGLVVLKLLVLGFIVGAGLFLAPGNPAGAAPQGGGPHPATAMFLILFAYSGWNSAAYVAGEIRDPRRTLPRALVGGVLVVTALYLAVNFVYFRTVPPGEMGNNINILGEVASRLLGEGGGRLVSLALTFVFIGSASAMVITGPRIYYAMALDGNFPRALTVLGEKSRVPGRSLWLQSLWAAAILLVGTALTGGGKVSETFDRIVSWTIFTILPFVALTACAVFVLRGRDRREGRLPAFLAPGHPWTGAVFVLSILAIEAASIFVGVQTRLSGEFWADRNRTNALIGCALVLSGFPVYALWRRMRSGRGAAGE